MSIEYLDKNRRLWYDYLIGLRGWGLVLYGALPSSLVALGVLKVEKLEVGLGLFGPFILFAVVPLLVLHLLVRQRLVAWYLWGNMLWIRSAVVAFAIFALSSLISWAAVYLGLGSEAGANRSEPWVQVFEAVIFGLVALVASSTLFMALVKESGGMPGLPSAEFVTDVRKLRDLLTVIGNYDIWQQADPSLALQKHLDDGKETAGRLARGSPSRAGRHRFFEELAEDLASTEEARSQVEDVETLWEDFFPVAEPTVTLNPGDQKLRAGVQRIRGVVLHA